MGGSDVWRGVRIGFVAVLIVLPAFAEEARTPSQRSESVRPEKVGGPLRHDTLGRRDGAPPVPPPRTVTPPGAYALSIDGAFDLGGYVFKNGAPFLHTDGGDVYANTALGVDALISSTPGYPTFDSGAMNTALGDAALRDNTTGSWNTASGAFTLQYNTVGSYNTANGAYALIFNTTGSHNTASGARTLTFNTTGGSNTAVGRNALYWNDSGYSNTALGVNALVENVSGGDNTATGEGALSSNTEGSSNTALGANALPANTVGSRNVAAGWFAGFNNDTGSDNIFISSFAADESNTLRIGQGTGTGNFEQNRAFISGIRGITTGQANAINVLVDSDGQLGTVSSSRRVKEDIRDMGEASRGLAELRPVTFRYRKAFENGDKPIRYGLIAEEVAEIFPDLVAYDAKGRPEAVLEHLLVPMLLNELQKQQQESAANAETVARLEVTLEVLLERLRRLEAGVIETRSMTASRRPPPAP